MLSLVLIVAAVAIRNARAGEISKKDLVYIGTVTAIVSAKTGDPTRSWVIATSVVKVVSGSLSSSTFEFAIHSPARAGLEVGASYTITARWHGNGYLVSEIVRRPAANVRAEVRTRPGVHADQNSAQSRLVMITFGRLRPHA